MALKNVADSTVSFRTNNFDLLRLLAATQVLIIHTNAHLHLNFSIFVDLFDLFPGVPIFFAISGFLISASYERSKSDRIYFQNRILRIYPGLWACILITIVVAIYFGFNFLHLSALKWFVAQLAGVIYTPAFLDNFGFGSYNGSLWTIPIELQFYIVMPLVYLLARTSKMDQNRVLLATFAVFAAIALLVMYAYPDMGTKDETRIAKLLRYSFFSQFYIFLAGMLLQRYSAYSFRFVAGKGLYWLLGYVTVSYLLPVTQLTEFVRMLILTVTVISLAYTLPGISQKLLRGNDIRTASTSIMASSLTSCIVCTCSDPPCIYSSF